MNTVACYLVQSSLSLSQQSVYMGNDTVSATWGQTHKGGDKWRQTVLMLIAACVEG